MRKQLLIGAVISATCLYFAFRGLSLQEVGVALRKADPKWLLLALTVYACSFMIRAYRWEKLMKPVKPVPASQLLRPMVIGFFANNVLPFRMGEIVRAHVAGQKLGISRTASLGTIVLERICDTISFLTIFLVVAFFFPFPGHVKHAASALGVGCAGLIVFLWFASKHHTLAASWIDRLPVTAKLRGQIQRAVVNFTQGVAGLRQGSYMAQAVALSMVVWTIEGTVDFLIVHAFPVNVTYPQAFFLLFFLGLSVTLPQAPGYVGTVELFGVLALTLLKVPKDMALSIVLTIHGCQFLFVMVLGLWALSKEHLSLGMLLGKETTSSD